MSKRVGVLTSVHPAFDARIFHKECTSLARAGYDVTLIVPHDHDEVVHGVQVKAVRRSTGRIGRMSRTAWRVYREAARLDADVYHIHDPELVPLGLFLRLTGKKVIYDIHEYNADSVLTKHWISTPLRRAVSKGVLFLDRFAVSKMSGTVVVNEDMVELFRSRVRSPRPLVAIHNYPLLPHAVWKGEQANREPVAIYVGSLSKERGLEVMLEAGKRLKRGCPDARLQLLGRLDLAGVRQDYTSVDRWHSFGVEYLGLVDHREVSKWLRRARVGLVPLLPTPNYIKAEPVKLFEYMLAELPVIASDFGVMGRIVRETGCGLVVAPGDPDALSGAVEAVLKNPGWAADMGEMGRRAILQKYNWESEEKKLLALYANIVGHA